MVKINTLKPMPPKGGEVMVEMLFDCIIFLAVTYISGII
jgi:hypothetical protein